MDTDDFYPPVTKSPNRKAEHTAKAREVCATCPVKVACLEHALDYYEQGIWGGTDENERTAIRRERYGHG